MRHLLLLIGLSSSIAFADCSSSGIYVFPENKEIYENSMFTLEGYYFSQEIIKDLDSNYTAYLVSEKERIQLHIIDRYQGQMDLYKVLLKPDGDLTMGVEFELKIIHNESDKEATDVMNRYNPATKKYESIQFKVTKRADKKVPVWGNILKHKENTLTLFGCGPANYSIFEASVTDASKILIKVQIRNKTTNEIARYLVPFDRVNGFISLGHGMCSGPFVFKSGNKYEANFKPIDECGNTGAGSLWYSFDNPVDIYRNN